MAWVRCGIPVLATSQRAVPASHAQIKLSRGSRYPPSLESGILGVRPCGGVRSALILDPAIDAPSLTGSMGQDLFPVDAKLPDCIYPPPLRLSVVSSGVSSRTPAPWHCFAYRCRRLPGGTGWRRTAALQDDRSKDVAMMEIVIPVSPAMSWARVIE